MIEQGFIKSHFVGRDGFIWWIGQVVDETQCAPNIPGTPTKTTRNKRVLTLDIKLESWGIILQLQLI